MQSLTVIKPKKHRSSSKINIGHFTDKLRYRGASNRNIGIIEDIAMRICAKFQNSLMKVEGVRAKKSDRSSYRSYYRRTDRQTDRDIEVLRT